ncbi:MAG TPA: tetratricopeptide repeat protein [Allosphingosinicella sp.]|nr:tetratricopeptide repeat protein [Allosphingosinicella sp.]
MNVHLPDAWGRNSIDLAAERDFALGRLTARPPLRRIELPGGQSVELEPRVMQVLVALHGAGGAVMSRDALIERCWGGRVVGDDALNRCIVALRRIARNSPGPAFEIETVPRVGYRLVEPGTTAAAVPPAAPRAERASIDRRLLIGGAAAAAAAAMGAGWWWASARPEPPPEALALYRKALEARGSASIEQAEQAVAYLREATRLAPDFAEAWGALALAYRGLVFSYMRNDHVALAARARSAAARALELDPDNADAQAALVLLQPLYGHWADVEAGCRRLLSRYPEHKVLLHGLATLLADVGRWNDAAEVLQRTNRLDPLMPAAHYLLIVALWSAGRLEDAEKALEDAAMRWPKHGAIWDTKVKFLAFTGRTEAAVALVRDVSGRPLDYPDSRFDTFFAAARALQTRAARDVDRAVALQLDRVAKDVTIAGVAAQYCAALGRPDEAFALLRGFYFGEGRWAAAWPGRTGAQGSQLTRILFQPLMASLWRDARFPALTEQAGLENYWRSTGTLPDYRA